ncbi:MAG: hypothetical protein KGQ77_00190 [Betaproteobacteria bacterium]|nr:hypothetical protein [Betaproteobacteria bacterium]
MLDAGERGIPGQVLNLRFRDGSIYQSVKTDDYGDFEFAELFPFFNWLVAEVDFTRFKATGATVVVDDGGPVDPTNPWSFGALSPQPQPENNGAPYRVELSTDPTATPVYNPVLLEGMQTFLGQTNVIHWGKKDYAPGENGGITGIVHYAGTRAEWDPRFAVAENNEPGIPDVEVRLYRAGVDGRPAAPDGTPIRPRGANESAQEYQAYTKQFALRISAGTDNWDNSLPTGCVDPFPFKINAGVDPTTGVPIGGTPMVDANGATCYDGMRIWNQVRPAVFDGGYAFFDYFPGGELNAGPTTQPVPIKPGRYVVEAIAPLGYEHQKEEDKNVDFGDLIAPGALAQPVECVGDRNDDPSIAQSVPLELAQFAGVAIPDRFRDTPTSKRPYCNKKLVVMGEGMNAAADFHMFTRVPVAGHIVGMILDDLANEFDPYSPNFGEKYAPPFMPVSIRDWTGREISRVYSDRYGTYNALVPSTFSYNIPLPSGVAPNIVTVCLNSPTMQVTDSAGVTKTVLDPHHNRQYSQFCYNFQYLPGKTTYLDTPVLPIAAFAGPSQFALDCENPATVPGIYAMTNGAAGPKSGTGPHVAVPASTGTADFTIYSEGKVSVPNPEYDQNNLGYIPPGKTAPAPKTIERDYGFGTATGKVTIGGIDVTASVVSWGDDAVSVKLRPATVTQIRREVFCPGIAAAAPCPAANNANRAAAATVLVTHANGSVTPRGVSLHIGGAVPTLVQEGQSIQAAVDAAAPGALITVGPGLYEENVIVDKRVRLQGFGAAGVVINAATQPTERLHYWRVLACQKVLANPAVLLPGQLVPDSQAACVTGDTADNAPLLFGTEESAGVFVLAAPVGAGNPVANLLQIDGLTISGSDGGGGIVVNGNAARIEISNNRVVSNQGIYGGGIRLGNPDLIANDTYVNARNNSALIHHNEIRQNGNTAGETNGGGGGISLYHGTHNYVVSNNQVCGNFSTGDGGGMAHFGRSNDGRIENNAFTFNQSFSQSKVVNGGGLAIAGVATPNNAAGISLGTGNVTIVNNLFQGNLAGAGDGGAISLYGVNGNDIRTANRFRVDVLNNVMVDNVAGLAGGGVALFDSPNVRIINNTIAHNDSTATAYPAFQLGTRDANGLTISAPQPGAGIAARAHSAALQAAVPAGAAFAQYRNFSNATLQNNVVWHNRQFYWQIDQTLDQYACAYNNAGAGGAANPQQCFGLKPNLAGGEAVVYSDFGVIGGPAAPGNYRLSPMNSVLTNAADPYINANASNVQGDPVFMASYFNGPRNVVGQLEQTTMQGMQTAAAFDEGQNFIDVRYGPLTLLVPSGANAGRPYGNYRATAAVAGVGLNFFSTIADLQKDAAGVPRDPTAAWAAGAFNAQ